MFNSPVLDLVVLLSFTYFIFSLLLSTINESIAGWLRLRQGQLKKSMENLFFEDGWKSFIRNSFNKTPAIQSLMQKKGKYPAYISAANFVQAIICELNINNYRPEKLMQELKDNTSIPKHFRELLINMYAQSQDDIKVFEKKVEDFFNTAMDRTTGWYKRKIKIMLLIIGFTMAVVLNIDTVKITSDALADKQKLSKAVDNISANLPRLDSLRSIIVTDSSVTVTKDIQNNTNKATLEYKQTSGYGFGYKDLPDFSMQWSGKNFWKKLLGMLITAFALQLGSNYWFDLMNKAVNIRSVGKNPEEKTMKQKTT